MPANRRFPDGTKLDRLEDVSRIALVLATVVVVLPATAHTEPPPAQPTAAACHLADLPGMQAAAPRLRRHVGSAARRDAWVEAAAREDFARVAGAVLGRPASEVAPDAAGAWALDADAAASGWSCAPGVAARDAAAARMLAAGYSALEVADVLTGRLSRRDLDEAYALRLAGASAREAAAHLEAAAAARAAARSARLARAPSPAPASPPSPGLSPSVESALPRLARAHGLDADLVRAVIAAESGGAADATSPAGAIGLMQLMPATARMLGVDPWDPLDNLRGGITYLSRLVRAFGTVREGLIAYNAGPSHAERVARGEAVLYGETRRYLEAIDRAYPLAR